MRITDIKTSNEEKLFMGILRFNAKVLGLTLGFVLGVIIFVATNWLVIKDGKDVGQHLQLLSQFFPGYTVTFIGSFIGFVYGFALGTFSGSLLGWIYNMVSDFRD